MLIPDRFHLIITVILEVVENRTKCKEDVYESVNFNFDISLSSLQGFKNETIQ